MCRFRSRRCVRRRSPCRCAPRSRLRRSPLPDPPTCPSTACRARSPARSSSLRRRASRSNSARCSSNESRGGGMHIRPRRRSRGSSRIALRERQQLVRRDAALAGLVLQPHLDAYIERRRVVRAAARSAARRCARDRACAPSRNCSAIGACLVRLQLADEVPGERQVGERRRAWAALPAGSSRRNRAGRSRPARESPRRAAPC